VNDETVTILRGNVSADASLMRFSFDMFRFVSEPHELYLHCSIQLCEPDDRALCTPVRLTDRFLPYTGISMRRCSVKMIKCEV